jgi:aconitate hydratase 2/2-methylisocitrate dehydratase
LYFQEFILNADFLSEYRAAAQARKEKGLPPLPLTAEQVTELLQLCQNPVFEEYDLLRTLIKCHIDSAHNPSAQYKEAFLIGIAKGEIQTPLFSRVEAVHLLGKMHKPSSVCALIQLLENDELGESAVEALAHSVFLFDAYYDVEDRYKQNQPKAVQLLKRWAESEWLTHKASLASKVPAVVFKVEGEVSVDQLSPLSAAWNRTDIPLHAQSLLNQRMPSAIQSIHALQTVQYPIAFVADSITTKDARWSMCQAAVKALLWHIGERKQYEPNYPYRGIILSKSIEDAFYEIAENLGVILLELDTDQLQTGDKIIIKPYTEQIILQNKLNIPFRTKRSDWRAVWQAEGRLLLNLGNTLTTKAQECIQLRSGATYLRKNSDYFSSQAYTRAQKIMGTACGAVGVKPGELRELQVSEIAWPLPHSNYDNLLKLLPTSGIAADLVIQGIRGTSDDVNTQGNIVLKPGDGMLHSWFNRTVLPDQVSIIEPYVIAPAFGLCFPYESKHVFRAAVTGYTQMYIPQSVLVRFEDKPQPGIYIRDIIHAIPYYATQKGKLTAHSHYQEWKSHILEIEGLPDIKGNQGIEFTEALTTHIGLSCSLAGSSQQTERYIQDNIQFLHRLLSKGYQSNRTIQRRIAKMQAWLQRPTLLKADSGAEYIDTLIVSLNELKEPLLADLLQPSQIIPLSQLNLESMQIDAVWIGSSAIDLSHYRIVGDLLKQHSYKLKTPLWVAPPSKLELKQLMQEGYYHIYSQAGVQTEMPNNALCVSDYLPENSTVVTTSARHFYRARNKNIRGYVTSPELATITAILGRLPSLMEYQACLGISSD